MNPNPAETAPMTNISNPCSNGDRCTSLPLPIPRTKRPVKAPITETDIAKEPSKKK